MIKHLNFNKQKGKNILLLIIGMLSFIWVAIYNGYPLVYADSGTYLYSSVTLESPGDRPLFYSIFLRITHMQAHNWIPIIFQGVIGSWLVIRASKLFLKENHFIKISIIFLLIGVLSASPWYASQLMPDIFTSFGVLTVFLYFFDNHKKNYSFIYLFLLFLTSSVHLSNPLILSACLLFFIGFYFFYQKLNGFKTKLLVAFIIAFSPFPIQSWINYAEHGDFVASREGNLFHIAKATESGMYQKYVRENKERITIPFAEASMNLERNPMNFLYSPESPINKVQTKRALLSKLYKPILKDMFSQWRYQKMFIAELFRAGFEQLKFHKIGSGIHPYRENSPPFWQMETEFESEFHAYKNSKQYKIGLEDNYHKHISLEVLVISWIFLLLFLIFKRTRKVVGLFIVVLIIGVVANAIVTGGLANVYDRLAVRVNWLLTFGAIIGLLVFIETYFETKKGTKHYL